jgi:hypothetical protein
MVMVSDSQKHREREYVLEVVGADICTDDGGTEGMMWI